VPELFTHEDFGIANAAKEALAFAILAHETLLGNPGNVPNATGARRAALLGKIVPG
jgi:anhydro-N-acetylmuramic acid kinase